MPLNRRSNRVVPESTLQQLREEALANSERLQREREALLANGGTTVVNNNTTSLVDTLTETPSLPNSDDILTEAPVESTQFRWTNFGGVNMVTGNPIIEKNEGFNKDTIVITVTGKKIKYSDAVSFKGEFYEKDHKDIVICAFTKKEKHKSNCTSVVESVQFHNDKPLFTYVPVHSEFLEFLPLLYSEKYGFEHRFLSDSAIPKELFKLSTCSDLFVDITRKEPGMSATKFYPQFKSKFKKLGENIQNSFKFGINSPTFTITEGLKYTMGVEIEVCNGFIPSYLAHNKLNLSCVRDGSINAGEGGPEYVTGILKGDTGFRHLQDICLELKNCRINHTCGVHVHLGNIDFTNQFLVNSYVLALLIEDELFSYLPKSRRGNRYCRKLKDLDLQVHLDNSKDNFKLEKDYNKLFKYISYDRAHNPDFNYNKDKQHPLGAKCGYNHETPRYCWLNYVPAMFNTRGNKSYSLEIRNHSGTTNFNKIRNWILLFMAIVAFTERYPSLIKPGITIFDILNKIYPKKSSSLKLYFKTRQAKFSSSEEDADDVDDNVKKTIKELIKE